MTEIKLSRELEDIKRNLKATELRFCEMVFEGMAPIDALVESGLNAVKDAPMADRVVRAPVIAAYIDALRRQVATRAVLSLEKIQERLSDIAMTNVTDILEIGETVVDMKTGVPVTIMQMKDVSKLTEGQLAAIKSMEPCPGGVKVKLHDTVKIMESLAKMQGAFIEKQEITHNGGVEVFAYVGSNGRGPAGE